MPDGGWLFVDMYLDLAGVVGVIDVVKGLFNGLPESNDAVIPQHQNLKHTHTHKVIVNIRRDQNLLELAFNETV